jgi:hypothetical protein
MMKRFGSHLTQKYFYVAVSALLIGSIPALAQQATAPNLVKNPGFEDGAANWKITKDTANVVSDVAHSGKNSLNYTNTDAKNYKMFTQKLDVHPGQQIHFSVWVKGQNLTGKEGAGLFVQSYDNSKYIGGAFPSTLTGTFDWKLVKGEYSIPPSATSTTVGLYLRKGMTGTAWFDDVEVQVEQPVPFMSFLEYPNYRGMVRSGDKTPWKFTVNINALPDWQKGNVNIKNVLTDSQEKVLFERSFQTSSDDTSLDVEFQPPANLSLGDYTLKQTISDPNGKVGLEKTYAIHVVAKMPKVYIDKEGFTVDNGKRIFPLGVYLGPTADEDLQRIADGGFNTILTYGYGSGKDPQAYMQRAQNHNLKVVYSVKDMYPDLRKAGPDAFEKAAGYIKQMRDNPALLAWYTNDELGSEWLPKLETMYNQVKQLDADHPTFQVLYQMGIMQKYFGVTDVLGADPYPVGSADLTKTATNTRITMAAAHGARGVWIVPQLMDWAVYHADREQHPPSLDEMRNQAYQAIINGATGLIWYSYYDMMYEKAPRGESTKNMTLFNKRWADASSMAHEIDGITPAILNGERVSLDVPSDAKVEAGALQYKNELLILLANPYYQEEKITLALPGGWKIKDADQGGIKSTFNKGQATFTLPSVGSGVFRLVKN